MVDGVVVGARLSFSGAAARAQCEQALLSTVAASAEFVAGRCRASAVEGVTRGARGRRDIITLGARLLRPLPCRRRRLRPGRGGEGRGGERRAERVPGCGCVCL